MHDHMSSPIQRASTTTQAPNALSLSPLDFGDNFALNAYDQDAYFDDCSSKSFDDAIAAVSPATTRPTGAWPTPNTSFQSSSPSPPDRLRFGRPRKRAKLERSASASEDVPVLDSAKRALRTRKLLQPPSAPDVKPNVNRSAALAEKAVRGLENITRRLTRPEDGGTFYDFQCPQDIIEHVRGPGRLANIRPTQERTQQQKRKKAIAASKYNARWPGLMPFIQGMMPMVRGFVHVK